MSENNKLIYFGLHIQKTAGTTLTMHLRQHVNIEKYKTAGANYYYQNGVCPIDELPLSIKKKLLIIWGHDAHESMLYKLDKKVFLFTFLRHPVDRAISWYKFRRDRLNRKESFKEFVKSRSNHMCKMLIRKFPSLVSSKEESLSLKAISVLNHFNFIGCQENFTNHSKLLLQKMRLPLIEEVIKYNVSKSNDTFDQDLVAEKNQEDLNLYKNFFADNSAENPYSNELVADTCSLFGERSTRPKMVINRLTGELGILNQYIKISERNVNDQEVVFRRLCSLYLTSKNKKRKVAILQLINQYCRVTGIKFKARHLKSRKIKG